MNYRISPQHIIEVKDDERFGFGSNEAGIHGAGAAKYAFKSLGAQWGKGVGEYGRTYAIPTKDYNIVTLPIPQIAKYVSDYIVHASRNKQNKYLTTEIGCGLAGFTPREIAPLFQAALSVENIWLPQAFITVLTH